MDKSSKTITIINYKISQASRNALKTAFNIIHKK